MTVANEVDIVITSQDKSRAGMQSAAAGADKLGASTRRVGEIAAGIVTSQVFDAVARGAQRAFMSTVKAASDLGESMNAVNVTFGNAADGIHALGEESAQSVGLSQAAFNQAAVSFANFAKTVAGPGGDVTKIIGDITKIIGDITTRSADFASVLNMDVDQAMEIFRSGLAGESEPLRRYGIDVSAAAVETFAYANGIAKAGTELTEAQKVQGRYGLIMQQTAGMANDFTNTQDSMANATRIARAELEDAQAAIGQTLLPVLAKLASIASDVAGAFGSLPGPVQAVVAVVGLLAAGFLILAPRIVAAKTAMATMSPAVTGFASKAGAALGAIGLLVAGFQLLTSTAKDFKVGVGQATEGIGEMNRGVSSELIERLGELHGKLDDADRILKVIPTSLGGMTMSGKEAAEVNAEFAATVEAVDQALANMVSSGDIEGAKEAVANLGRQWGLSGKELRAFVEEHLPQYRDQLAASREEVKAKAEAEQKAAEHAASFAGQQEALNKELEEAKTALDEATAAVDEHISAIRDATDPIHAFHSAQEEFVAAQKEVNRLEREGKADTKEYEDAVWNLVGAGRELDASQIDAGRSVRDMRDALELAFRQGRISKAQYDRQTEALDKLERQAKNTEGEYNVRVPLEGERHAKQEIDNVREKALRLARRKYMASLQVQTRGVFTAESQINHAARDRISNISLRFSGSSRALSPFMAQGGLVGAQHAQGGGPRGNDVIVGETGPELVELPVGSRVIPSGQTATRLSADVGGGGPINININVHGPVGSPQELLNWMTEALDQLQRMGRLPSAVAS